MSERTREGLSDKRAYYAALIMVCSQVILMLLVTYVQYKEITKVQFLMMIEVSVLVGQILEIKVSV